MKQTGLAECQVMEQVNRNKLWVVEGEGGDAMLSRLPGALHDPWQETAVAAHEGWLILNASGPALQEMLGPCFRHRRTFALPGLEWLAREEALRLQGTARKRKSRSVVLGGWRLLPVAAACKEMLSGGCLGTVARVRVTWKEGWTWREEALANDLLRWLGEDTGGEQKAMTGAEDLTVQAEGSCGTLLGTWNFQAGGRLEACVDGHRKVRAFHNVDAKKLEIGVMKCLGMTPFPLPGLVTCANLFP